LLCKTSKSAPSASIDRKDGSLSKISTLKSESGLTFNRAWCLSTTKPDSNKFLKTSLEVVEYS
jgi:hypothetical protein